MSVEGSESTHKADTPQPPRSCWSLVVITEKNRADFKRLENSSAKK